MTTTLMIKDTSIGRLKKVLLSDKINMPNGLLNVIERDTANLLNEYFQILPGTVRITVSESDGFYELELKAKAESVKPPKILK